LPQTAKGTLILNSDSLKQRIKMVQDTESPEYSGSLYSTKPRTTTATTLKER